MAKSRITPPGAEEEIIEKKPSAPMAIALLMITFVVLIVGIYLDWNLLTERYFDPRMYNSDVDALQIYKDWQGKKVREVPANPMIPELGDQGLGE